MNQRPVCVHSRQIARSPPSRKHLLFRDGCEPSHAGRPTVTRPPRQSNRPHTGHTITNTPLTQAWNHTRSFAVSHRPFGLSQPLGMAAPSFTKKQQPPIKATTETNRNTIIVVFLAGIMVISFRAPAIYRWTCMTLLGPSVNDGSSTAPLGAVFFALLPRSLATRHGPTQRISQSPGQTRDPQRPQAPNPRLTGSSIKNLIVSVHSQ